MRKKKEERKMTKSDFFGGLFLGSCVLKGMFAGMAKEAANPKPSMLMD